MATIFDTKQENNAVVMDRAAVEHNAQIKARYQRLQSVEQSQFAELSYQAPKASVLAPERPAQTQSPMQYTHERVVSPVFTPEILDKTLEKHAVGQAPAVQVAPVTTQEIVAEKAEGLQLSRFAKGFLGGCAAAVTVMLGLICAFTQVINSNNMKLNAMEKQNAELRSEYAAVMEDLSNATSYETIEQYALAHGMVKAN